MPLVRTIAQTVICIDNGILEDSLAGILQPVCGVHLMVFSWLDWSYRFTGRKAQRQGPVSTRLYHGDKLWLRVITMPSDQVPMDFSTERSFHSQGYVPLPGGWHIYLQYWECSSVWNIYLFSLIQLIIYLCQYGSVNMYFIFRLKSKNISHIVLSKLFC